MRRQVVSSVLATRWLWPTNSAIGCCTGSRADCSLLRASLSDRMQVYPDMLVNSYSAEKEHFDSTRVNAAVRSPGHGLLTWSGRRGLQAFASSQGALNAKPCVVIYDGVCHLCNAGVNWIIKVDKKKAISFCALQSRAAEPYLLLCGLTREGGLFSLKDQIHTIKLPPVRFIYISNFSRFTNLGSNSVTCHVYSVAEGGIHVVVEMMTAALKVASYLPFPYSTLSTLVIIPAPIRDAVYDYVAKRRYQWFGKSTECITACWIGL